MTGCHYIMPLVYQLGKQQTWKKKVENYILKDFPKGRMQMRCKCLWETFPSNLNNYKLYKLLKSQPGFKKVSFCYSWQQHCWDIVLGVTSENTTIHTPPPPFHLKLGGLLFSTGSLKSGTTLLGRGGGGKALFSPP